MTNYFYKKEPALKITTGSRPTPTQTESPDYTNGPTTVPKYNRKGHIVGSTILDIGLYFDPYIDPTAADNQSFQSNIDSLYIPTGANEITWGYGVNTKRISTYGGEVVQILSVYADKMTITGNCRNFDEQRKIYDYFSAYMKYVSGSTGGELDRRQNFLQFRYPARNWSFVIMVIEAPQMTMRTGMVAPEWRITAEIVSENARAALGKLESDQWGNVLNAVIKKPVGNQKRIARSGTNAAGDTGATSPVQSADPGAAVAGGVTNFLIRKDQDPFGDLMSFMDGGRGAVAENFEAMIASYATGNVDTLVTNPLNQPEKSAEEIWREKFGTDVAFTVGGSVGSGGSTGSGTAVGGGATGGAIVYGQKTRVFATTFGGHGDASNTGHVDGQAFDLVANPDSYAELSTNMYNSANGPPPDGKSNDYAALGKLPALTPIKVTNPKNGKSMTLYKRDVGFGGPGPDGKRGTNDDPKIDIWHTAADQLGFNGFDYLEIEIGTATGAGTSVDPTIPAQMSASYKEAIAKLQGHIRSGRLSLEFPNDKEAIMRGDGVVHGHMNRGDGNVQFDERLLRCLAYIIDSTSYKFFLWSMVGDHFQETAHWVGKGMDLAAFDGVDVSNPACKTKTITVAKLLNEMPDPPTRIIIKGNGRADPDVSKYTRLFGMTGQAAIDAYGPDTMDGHDDHIHVGYNENKS